MRKESDLAGVKSVAKMLLMTKVNKPPFSPMVVQHPFTNTGIVGLPKDGGQELEILDITAERKNLTRWQVMVEKQIDRASDPCWMPIPSLKKALPPSMKAKSHK